MLNGKTQAMGLVGAVVRVLSQDDHFHTVKGRQVEGVKNIWPRRENRFSFTLLLR